MEGGKGVEKDRDATLGFVYTLASSSERVAAGSSPSFRHDIDDIECAVINRSFWRSVRDTVRAALQRSSDGVLLFREEEKHLVDFGYLPASKSEEEIRRHLTQLEEEAAQAGVLLLHQCLARTFGHVVELQEREKYLSRSEEMEKSLHALERYLADLRERRDRLLQARLTPYLCPHIHRLDDEIEDSLIETLSLELRAQRTRQWSDREHLLNLREHLEKIQRERRALLQSIDEPHQVELLNHKIEECCRHIFGIRKALESIQGAFERLAKATKSPVLWDAFENQIAIFQSFAQMAARSVSLAPFSPLLDPQRIPKPAEIQRTLASVTSQTAMSLPHRKDAPLPLLLPGNGAGVYDWNHHLYIIPTQPIYDLSQVAEDAIQAYRRYAYATAVGVPS